MSKKTATIKFSWKKAFFSLVIINMLIVLVFVGLMFLPINEPKDIKEGISNNHKSPSLFVAAKKKDLNVLINEFIEKENANGPIDYKVWLEEEVELYGTLPIFNNEVEMKLTFQPKALKNGDIVLTQNTISIGKLELPTRYVMNFIRKNYHFPKWVEIFPNEHLIYIHLSDIELKNQLSIHAETFDLKNDDISFSLIINQ